MKQVFLLLCAIITLSAHSQTKYTLSGVVTDVRGEALIGANVIISELQKGTITNENGYFTMRLPEGKYKVLSTYIGYTDQQHKINLVENTSLNFELKESDLLIEAVEVTAEAPNFNVAKVEMSTNKLEMKEIQKLPVVFGEGDIIKTLQLLPGVISAGEASGGFHVRGGNVDQNLILTDKAHVYNASHFIGFFSVFNSNVIDDVKLYKGGIPAEYGGRLSSVLEIKTIEPNMSEYEGEASVGVISSKAIVQGPLIKDKASFFISGRRTYADLMLLFAKDSLAKESGLFFYDVNAKIQLVASKKDRIYLSAYKGRDIARFGDFINQSYGNGAYSLRWNHIFNNTIYLNTYVTATDYIFDTKFSFGDNWGRIVTEIQDYGFKPVLTIKPNNRNNIKIGGEIISHDFSPGHVTGLQDTVKLNYKLAKSYSFEYGLFFESEQIITPRLTLLYGLRYSLFHNIGKGISYAFDASDENDYEIIDTNRFENGEIYNLLPNGFEPRLSIRFMVNDRNSIKASYNRMYQYIQLASNSTGSLPLEYWFSSSPNIKPQIADQIAVGYFRNLNDNMFEFSVEGFYKNIQNSIDFKDHANLLLNDYYEGELRVGKAWAYGSEFLLRKQKGDFTGWISYTFSRTFKEIPEINNGEKYPAHFDKPHDLAVVLSYDISERLNVSGNWVYTSAPPRTMPSQRWFYGGSIAPAYGERNSVRVFPYHRMDLAATIRLNKVEHDWEHSLNLSVYNVYARHNYLMLSFLEDSDIPFKTKGVGTYLYKAIPSLSYTFKF